MKRAIVTGGTKSDTAPMAVFAINIRDTNADLFDELVIFHDGIKLKDQELINSIFPTRFIEYKYPNKSKNNVILSYFSEMLFCKYECFNLLDNYDEVMWSDYDVVVQGRLDEMCNVKYNRINCLTYELTIKSMLYKDIVNDEILQYDLDDTGMITPIFTISKFNENPKDICNWCYDKTAKWDKDIYLPEQCVLSLALQTYDIICDRFPSEIYACHPSKSKGNEIILHTYGQPKFWNGLHNAKWDEMYAEWRDIGGSAYCEWKKRLARNFALVKSKLVGNKNRKYE